MFIFAFVVNTLRGGSEKMLLSFMSESVWPMFSSKSFIVSGLLFRSFIHFAFIVCRLLDDSHSGWCKVVPHCGFDLHFSNNYQY